MEPRDPRWVEDPGAVDALLRSTGFGRPEGSPVSDRPALGRDPFAEEGDFDPF